MQHDNGANRCEFPNSLPSYLPKGVTTFEPVTLVSHHSGMRIKNENKENECNFKSSHCKVSVFLFEVGYRLHL